MNQVAQAPREQIERGRTHLLTTLYYMWLLATIMTGVVPGSHHRALEVVKGIAADAKDAA